MEWRRFVTYLSNDPCILRDIAIFIFGLFGLKLPIHAHFGRVLGDMTGFPLELGTGARGQKTRELG